MSKLLRFDGKAYQKKRRQTKEYKINYEAYMKKYRQKVRYKNYHKNYQKKYSKTLKWKNYIKGFKGTPQYRYSNKKYWQSSKGKMNIKRIMARRKRNLGFVPIMNNPFPTEIKIAYHHINDIFVAPTPKRLHYSFMGKEHRIKVNKSLKNLGFNLESFMNKNG